MRVLVLRTTRGYRLAHSTTEHVRRHGFAESARSRNAHVFLLGPHDGVRDHDCLGLVNVDGGVYGLIKSSASWIQVDSHNRSSSYSLDPAAIVLLVRGPPTHPTPDGQSCPCRANPRRISCPSPCRARRGDAPSCRAGMTWVRSKSSRTSGAATRQSRTL